MNGTRFSLEVQPQIPKRLARLEELANDLMYSWDRRIRGLFVRLDPDLWERCGHNPKLLLKRIAQERLNAAAKDRIFIEDMNRALSAYDTYHQESVRPGITPHLDAESDLVAYFCAEFGLHESLPIYSGGLGILAGDHCKAASDLTLPFVAVGMLYRQGYFIQTVDAQGQQVAHYSPTDFESLPTTPATSPSGGELHVYVDMPERRVALKVWLAKAGHITLCLLDSDVAENSASDRAITHQLYGGDIHTRIQQEIVLGIGGVRALRALNMAPTVWHINEGHAAFQVLERCRELTAAGADFDSALEQVASGTVFTTHTPVPAGHDIFDHHLMHEYFAGYIPQLKLDMPRFLELGVSPGNEGGFNQTALALRGSRFHNGVSRIHGGVASRMEAYVWPQIPHEENPISYVTNGVHLPTFLAREWLGLLDMRFGAEWRNELNNEAYWSRLDEIPDYTFWSLRQSLKSELLEDVRERAVHQYSRNGVSATQIKRLTRELTAENTDVLILGFARRFATYKRATLLFSDPERLARIINDPERPVIFIFAGKAHPHDIPGQQLIKTIHEYSRHPSFEGKIIMLEGYDMALGRKLVSGVDVWVNTPEYPMEASGTSGQKAGMNGVLNLSVLDGWWGEGYTGDNGWAITPHGPDYDHDKRNQEEARELLDILEKEVVPLYYDRNGHGYPEGWVKMAKASMKTLIPRFNAQRMVLDYVAGFYGPAAKARRRLSGDGGAPAKQLAAWKKRVAAAWPKVTLRRLDPQQTRLTAGQSLNIEVGVHLGDLKADDITVECLVGKDDHNNHFELRDVQRLQAAGTRNGETVFRLDLHPPLPGLQYYKLRAYPSHPLLSHPFEMGLMIWV
ncbi:MAG TPA: glycosyltransferase family 1 protein [Gammaproteobacteria bacterium]|nr:glycosyltransferase family 1 protein [Gammaproteobacteria bacterium]